ncbi:hypothetical protein ADK55_31505 [Streptomyces sp. WM4235]|nr:hypothetical protein ADK55_31505 [Streptomyces sp. WM4235]
MTACHHFPHLGGTSTVADAKTKATDGTPVTLTGYVIQEVGPGQYKFQDVTGTITVEISREDLPPTEFNEKTKLKIRGDVDKSDTHIRVSVDIVEITA